MAQLYFYYSAMNAGKSTALLQSAHNYRERGMDVVLYTAAIDDRFGEGKISSRIGIESDALTFDSNYDFFEVFSKDESARHSHCIFVDEAQFLTSSQVDQLAKVVDFLNIPVLAYGIRTDFQGQLFPGSQRLLAIADKLSELKTICHCGRKATMIVRMDEHGNVVKQGQQVEIGGNDKYVSMCRKHYREAMEHD